MVLPVLGVDYGGSAVHFCVLGVGKDEAEMFSFSDSKWVAGDPYTLSCLHAAARKTSYDGAFAVVESPITGASMNLQTSAKMAMAAGAIVTGLRPNCTVELVPPATWKKEVTGRGNSNKAEVAAWLEEHHPRLAALAEATSRKHAQDLKDAACLALCAQGRMGG